VVLAETEDAPELAPPEWLDSVVKREVTGLRKYEWESLARGSDSSPAGGTEPAKQIGSRRRSNGLGGDEELGPAAAGARRRA
jgi:hypothetical protein